MSFWDNVKKFTQPYSDDEEYDDFDDEEMEPFEPEQQEAPVRHSRRENSGFNSAGYTAPAAERSGFSGQVLNMNASGAQQVILFRPTKFDDSTVAAKSLREKKAILLNLENVDKSLARRVVDFLSGCAFALDGRVKKVAQSTYLFCPYNMEIVGDLENLQGELESYE